MPSGQKVPAIGTLPGTGIVLSSAPNSFRWLHNDDARGHAGNPRVCEGPASRLMVQNGSETYDVLRRQK
jgi:hypothetical protein